MDRDIFLNDKDSRDRKSEGEAGFARKHHINALVGQIALVLSLVPRDRHHSLADLRSLVLDPLMRDRIMIATAKTKNWPENVPGGPLVGFAFWASASEEVDAKIREQIKAGAFPIKLKPEEWSSGDKVWLFDVVAPSQKLASTVLANFRQVTKQNNVRIHPVAARMVDPELLEKMKVSPETSASLNG